MLPKKTLIAFDGSFYAVNALDFAIAIASDPADQFIGIFIQDLSYPFLGTSYGIEPQPFEYSYEIMNQMIEEDLKEIDKNIILFTERCKEAGIKFKVHQDKGVPADELVRESAFADIIVTGIKTYFSNITNDDGDSVVNELLENAHCPVWIVPDEIKRIDEIVFAYDGLESSVWAIKQFTYLYGEQMKDKAFTLLSIKTNEADEIENEKIILEYTKVHYPDIRFINRVGKVEDEIPYFVKTSSNAALVLGMQHRNFFSRIFNPGHTKNLLQASSLPVFIAHC